jgi:hypothetical protein
VLGTADGYSDGVIEREDLGTWIEGTPTEEGYVRGARWGLPADGPRSVAGSGRRLISLFVDWGLVSLLSYLFFDFSNGMTLVLFACVNLLLITLFGSTPGQFALRVQVTPVRGRIPMVLRAVIRTALLMLVVPGMIWNKDGQPLQDVAAGTAVVRL